MEKDEDRGKTGGVLRIKAVRENSSSLLRSFRVGRILQGHGTLLKREKSGRGWCQQDPPTINLDMELKSRETSAPRERGPFENWVSKGGELRQESTSKVGRERGGP